MAKYYASEMSMRVSNDAVAVLGGSGYMKDYACQRHLRDSRITTIYEGTSQLQVIAAVAGVISGTARTVVEDILSPADGWPAEVKDLADQVRAGLDLMDKGVEYVKAGPGVQYRDLYARKLVDVGVYLVVGALFCEHAAANPHKKAVARYWLGWRMPEVGMLVEQVCSGETSAISEFEVLAPSTDSGR